MGVRAILSGALLATGVGCVAVDAGACGFIDYRPRVDVPVAARPKPKPKVIPAADLVALADQRIEQERLADAASLVLQAYPHLATDAIDRSPLELHAKRILALAIVRTRPATAAVTERTGVNRVAPSGSVAWSISTLRAIDASRHGDPVAQADLGEALVSDPTTEAEGLALLDDLASRDLIGSPHAYAALARLHAGKGEQAAARADLARCQTMTRQPSTVCKPADARVASND